MNSLGQPNSLNFVQWIMYGNRKKYLQNKIDKSILKASEIIYLRENAGNIRSQERYNITLNGVRYTYETTDTNVPADDLPSLVGELVVLCLSYWCISSDCV